MRYLEDFQVNQQFQLGEILLSSEDIVAFARRYDPQPFHLQDDPAGPFGGLIASGWQTGSQCQALMVEALLKDTAGLGCPGVDAIRFLQPVKAGITYTVTLAVIEVAESRSRSDRGHIKTYLAVTDPNGSLVYTLQANILIQRRNPRAA